MPRGGRRPGAGAPPGNLNALKHGLRSQQFAYLGGLLAQDPAIREALLRVAKRHQLKQRRAQDVAALLFTMLFERANQIANGRLNVVLPADDWRSIKETADRLMPNRYAPAPKKRKFRPGQSSRKHKTTPSIREGAAIVGVPLAAPGPRRLEV